MRAWRIIWLLILAAIAGPYCAGKIAPPKPLPDQALNYDYESAEDFRAARALRGIRFEGTQQYLDKYRGGYSGIHSAVRFSRSSNELSITIHGENRRGRIIDTADGSTNARKGHYWIETWKPMRYIGFDSGPARVEFKTYQLVWKVKEVASPEFTGPLLSMRVLDEQGRVESHGPVPALKLYILRGVSRRQY